MGKEAKTNAMRILEREKVPYTAHEYAHEEGVAVAEIDLSRLRAFRSKFPALDDADRFTVDL
jgi:predicted amidohydrolase